ncbi:MAG: MaoC family dehydratase [Hyphomicrobiales bacterium]|jgi:acyl dehydratase|nr:MaoC family dehydratase [Hyphomicrobiales bacterium]
MPRLTFEDFKPGTAMTYGRYAVTLDEIRAYASEYDPQPMHLDAVAAQRSLLGGLAASGWHSCCMMMRMLTDSFLINTSCMGAPGVDEVRWLKPVYPGDVLTVRHTVLSSKVSQSKPDRGFVSFHFEMLNQNGDVVLDQRNAIMFGLRDHGGQA